MSAAAARIVSVGKFSVAHGCWIAVAASVIALLFFRAPQSPGDGDQSYRMLLDLSFRPEVSGAFAADTLDGVLAPLQNPIYVGRSIWRSIIWQIGGNLLMAAVLALSVVRLPKARAAWALAFFAVLGMAETSLAPWIVIFCLSFWATSSGRTVAKFLAGVGMGMLAATSIAHLLLAFGGVALTFNRRDGGRIQGVATAGGLLVGFIGIWLLLEQSFARLLHWLWFGLTGGWTPSDTMIPPAVARGFLIAAAAMVVWVAFILVRRKAMASAPETRRNLWLVAWGMFVAWKLTAVQPAGAPLLFFATVIFGGFVLLPRAPRIATLFLALGVVGVAIPDDTLLTDAAGRLNRRVLQNLNELRHLADLRVRLRQNFSAYAAGLAMPKTRGALERGSATVVGDHAMVGILNEFRIVPPASAGSAFARDDSAAKKNAAVLLAAGSAPFVLQNSDSGGDLLPGLRDGPARLVLLQKYDLSFYEQGFSLWEKKSGPSSDRRELIKSGTVRFGDEIALPSSEEACWLELECAPTWTGLLFDQAKPLAEPSIRIVDSSGNQLRYALAWRLARAGFLVRPFFRGDLDGLRYQEGEELPSVHHVIIDAPASAATLWRATVRFRFFRISDLTPARIPQLSQPVKEQFAALNRLPTLVAAPFAPVFAKVGEKPSVFMHPDSFFEMAVAAGDRVLTGSFGISPGAYDNPAPNVTDGVAFTIEFQPAQGPRTILLRRYLDPAANLSDRGLQAFAIAIPASAGGRLVFRTANETGKNSAFDWSYWREIELK